MATRFKEVVYAKALSPELRSVVFSATEPILRTRWTIKPVGSDGWSAARNYSLHQNGLAEDVPIFVLCALSLRQSLSFLHQEKLKSCLI